MRAANVLTVMCGCAGSSAHLLVAYVISDRIQFEINPFSFLYINPNVSRTLLTATLCAFTQHCNVRSAPVLLKKLLLLLSSGTRGHNFATPMLCEDNVGSYTIVRILQVRLSISSSHLLK